MQPTDPAEVCSSIMSLSSNKSCDVDYIPTKIDKLSASTIFEHPSILVKKAFSLRIFPDCLKVIAKVVPIYKSGDKTTHQATDLFPYLRVFLKSLRN